jgi:hypothetical protein
MGIDSHRDDHPVVDPDADPAVSTGDWNYYRSADDQYSVLPFFGVRADPFDGGQGQVLELHPGVPSAEGQGNTVARVRNRLRPRIVGSDEVAQDLVIDRIDSSKESATDPNSLPKVT